jgi:hypothetical protein
MELKKLEKPRDQAKNRFRIEKLEKRIAPKQLVHVHGHAHVHVKV